MNHLGPPETPRRNLQAKGSEDIVITLAIRTPLTKARKGGFKDTTLDELLIAILSAVRDRCAIDPALIEDVCVGNVLATDQAYIARSAVLASGFPATTAASVCNRFCSSGLLAIQQIASQIATGSIDIGLAVGAESMSTCPDRGAPVMTDKIMTHNLASQNMQPMGQTSENVAGDFGISREAMDAYASTSHQYAERARKEGWTMNEIVPIIATVKDPMTGKLQETLLTEDDGIRPGTTPAALARIRSAFPQWKPSQTTGGNASQIADGAAAVLLMTRTKAKSLGLPILGKFVRSTVVGLEPRIMGIGPSIAIPKLLRKLGLNVEDIDLYEINEAFASMVSSLHSNNPSNKKRETWKG
jgi:acetyl-CoA acetyltransferase family protein